MARHSSWRAGGVADRFYTPADREDLVDFIRALPPHEPVLWVGLGSNLLVRDGGFRGTVLCTAGVLDGCALVDACTLRVDAGVACAKLARMSAKAGFTGAEFFAGIPGTLGGALAMNAGAFGGETWELVTRVETLDRQGRRWLRDKSAFRVGYRMVRGPEQGFLSADLQLRPDPSGKPVDQIRKLLARRTQSQPTGQPSCGSVFRNPPGEHAARLIERSGLKGFRIGNAQVSDKHANFIVNLGGASAAEIEALIEHVKTTVARRAGVELALEVQIVGEAALGQFDRQ